MASFEPQKEIGRKENFFGNPLSIFHKHLYNSPGIEKPKKPK